MSSDFNYLRLEQLQSSLDAYAGLRIKRPPSRGWLKEIREALGMTERQQAARLGVTGSAVHKSEQSEADERITLGQLRRMADSLGCDLVYAVVPRKPLEEVVQGRATQLAIEEVHGVAHTMGLEDQRPTDARIQRQVTRRAEELLRGKWSELWR
ncbi:MAG: mobile mystery protein A [Burkholderiales bacterium]